MNQRFGLFAFVVIVLLAVMIFFQIMAMVQSDRLYLRLNHFETLLKENQNRVVVSRGSSSTTGTVTNNPVTPGNADAIEGDWLVWHMGSEPSNLNPYTSSDAVATYVNGVVFESLLKYDLDTLELKPSLAESYKISDDGLEIYFKLRDDIHFSDGVPITADDVVFSFSTIKNPGVDAPHLANYLKDFESVEKISDKEVVFKLSQCYFKSLGIAGGIEIIPQHIYKFDDPQEFNKMQEHPIGSGPYVFESWDRMRQIVVRRNENYWGEKPNILKMVYKIIINDTSAMQSFMKEEMDYMSPSPEQYIIKEKDEEFRKKADTYEYWTPGNGYFYIGWNQRTPFFADKRVRQAMTLMINRQEICDYLLEGIAEVPTGPFYKYGPQSDQSIEPWPYDPERAAALLDEAGWIDTDGDGVRDKDGEPMRFRYMIVSGVNLHERIVKVVREAAAKLGIEVVSDPYEWSVFVDRLHRRDFDAVNLAWGGSIESDPYQIWHSSQIEGRGSNYIGFNMPEADKLIEQARQTLDEDKRNELYHQFHRIIHEQQPYTFVYTKPSLRFLHKRFKNVSLHKLGLDPEEWYVPLELQKYQ